MTFTELGSGNSRGLSCAFIVHSRRETFAWKSIELGLSKRTLNPKTRRVIQEEPAVSDGLQPLTAPGKPAETKQVYAREITGPFASRLREPVKQALGATIAQQFRERGGTRAQHPYGGTRASAHGELDERAQLGGPRQPTHHPCLRPGRAQFSHPIE